MALLEGPHLVHEAQRSSLALDRILVTPELLRELGTSLPSEVQTPRIVVTAGALATVTDSDSPQGIVAVARLPRGTVAALPVIAGQPYLFLEGVQDPGNLGALARVAEATGCAGIALGEGCAHPNHPRSLRASAGSLLRLPVAMTASAAELTDHLVPIAPRWVALTPRGGDPLWQASLDGTVILTLGAEGPGLSPALLARCSQRLRIPMAAATESLNVAVAAAVVLFEIRRRLSGP